MQTRFLARLLALTLLFSSALASTAQAQLRSTLTVQVTGIRGNQGNLCYKVFATAQGFPNGDEGAIKRQCSKISGDSMSFDIGNLRSGSYAVALYHDKNGNNKFDRNLVGMPTEAYGFSQNPKVTNRAPSFGDCLVLLAGSGLTTQIRMQYP
jgi:uncharacterized protein (DUF2141 family)